MLNKVFFIGNLTDDPKIYYNKSSTSICKFSIAINQKYKDKNDTLFMPVVCFKAQAENCNNYLSKGSKVFVEGSLNMNKWETDSGEKREKVECKAFSVQFLDSKNKTMPDEEAPF
jgi:single-strand DNA-binding protein